MVQLIYIYLVLLYFKTTIGYIQVSGFNQKNMEKVYITKKMILSIKGVLNQVKNMDKVFYGKIRLFIKEVGMTIKSMEKESNGFKNKYILNKFYIIKE